jgi:hypothetical protein
LYFTGSAIAVIILGISIPQPSAILIAFATGAYRPHAMSSDDVLLIMAVMSAVFTCIILFTLTGGSPDWRANITRDSEKYETGE